MSDIFLPRKIRRGVAAIYKKVNSYNNHCLDVGDCEAVCCTNDVPMAYIEFAYLIHYINKNLPEEKIRDVLTRKPSFRAARSLHGDTNYYCKILEDGRCVAYPARPFRCRIYIRDEEMSICRPLEEREVNYKLWMSLAEMNLSLGLPEELSGIEKDIDFWIERSLDL